MEINVQYLRAIRMHLGLTMEDIAKELRTTKQTISNLEMGKPTTYAMLRLYEIILWEKIPKSEEFWEKWADDLLNEIPSQLKEALAKKLAK